MVAKYKAKNPEVDEMTIISKLVGYSSDQVSFGSWVRLYNVVSTSWRCIDVEATLYRRHVSAGHFPNTLMNKMNG